MGQLLHAASCLFQIIQRQDHGYAEIQRQKPKTGKLLAPIAVQQSFHDTMYDSISQVRQLEQIVLERRDFLERTGLAFGGIKNGQARAKTCSELGVALVCYQCLSKGALQLCESVNELAARKMDCIASRDHVHFDKGCKRVCFSHPPHLRPYLSKKCKRDQILCRPTLDASHAHTHMRFVGTRPK